MISGCDIALTYQLFAAGPVTTQEATNLWSGSNRGIYIEEVGGFKPNQPAIRLLGKDSLRFRKSRTFPL